MARRERRGRRGAARHETQAGAKPGARPSRPKGRDARPAKAARARPAAKPQPPQRRAFPEVVPGPLGPPRVGEWLFTTRPGAERDLIEELYFADARSQPRPVGDSLVAARSRPGELAFARQGFVVTAVVAPSGVATAVYHALAETGAPQPWAIDAWVPDSDEGNVLAAQATALATGVSVAGAWADKRVSDARAALAENGLYAQLCLLPPGDRVAVGVIPARDAPSLAPGGRLRVHVPDAAPSRAAMKLLEAFLWLDRAPDAGELCVDLGAAPGGWSWVLLERHARVIAVDPAFMARSLKGKRGLQHMRADAFKFEPREPADWLFSDMAWRPLESAGLLAKWARRGWARLMIANIKLPMKKKAEMLARVKEMLDDAGWKNLRARQLYHDREEVTVAGVRL